MLKKEYFAYVKMNDSFLGGQIHKYIEGNINVSSSLDDCPKLKSIIDTELLKPTSISFIPNWQVRQQSGYYMELPYLPDLTIKLFNKYNIEVYIFRVECYDFDDKKLSQENCGINPDITYNGITLPKDKENIIKKIRIINSDSNYSNGYIYITLSAFTGAFESIINRLHSLETKSIVSKIKINGIEIQKDEDNIINLPLADSNKDGLLSKEDKTKLDEISTTSPIIIEGSGVSKNASSFGFLPTNDATTNTLALQKAVIGGGTILIDLPGTYEINGVIQLEDNTTLLFGANTFLKKMATCPVFINKGAFTRTYNSNIKIIGLHLICNNKGGLQYDEIYGLYGHVEFFLYKKLRNIRL